MKLIPLTQGKFAQVDDEDYDYLNQWKWYTTKNHKTFYAARHIRINGKQKLIYMHRVIMNIIKGYKTDHIDHNGLNNQKYNLRICTCQENNRNRKKILRNCC